MSAALLSRRPRPGLSRPAATAPPLDPETLPGLLGHWPALGSGTGAAYVPTNTNPGTFSGSLTWNTGPGSSPSVFGGGAAGSLANTTGANSLAHTSFTALLPSRIVGHGRCGLGQGFLLSGWFRATALPPSGTARPLWIAPSGGYGLYLAGTPAGATLEVIPGGRSPTHTITAGTWTFFALSIDVLTLTMHYWVKPDGGTLAEIFSWGPPGALNLNTILGYPGGGFNGSACEFRYYDRPLLPEEFAALAGGGEAAVPPIYHWPMHEGTGTTAADVAPRYTPGTAVATLPDARGNLHPLTQATPAARPVYETAAVRPVDDIPLLGEMDGVLRFDSADDSLAKPGVLGSAVTQLSVMLAGRFWDPYHGVTNGTRFSCWGASKAGWGTAAADRWLTLGGLAGMYQAAPNHRPWLFEAALWDGTALRFARSADPMHAWPVTLGLRYAGGSSLALFVNGRKAGETTASLPASLDLSGAFALCPNPGGWQHHDMVAGTALWTDAQMLGLHRHFARAGGGVAIPDVRKSLAYQGGGFGPGDNPTGYNNPIGLFVAASGRWHLIWTSRYSDPADGRIQHRSSDDRGATWGPVQVLYDPPNPQRVMIQGSPIAQLAPGGPQAGRILVIALVSDDLFTGPHHLARLVSDDDGVTWSAPVDCILTEPDIINAQTNNRIVEMTPGGELRTFFHLQKSSYTGGLYTMFYVKSVDGGITWQTISNVQVAAGEPTTYAVEGQWLFTGPGAHVPGYPARGGVGNPTDNILMVMRAGGGPLLQTQSADGGLTWSRFLRFGTNSGGNPDVEPDLYRAQDGRIFAIRGIRYFGGVPADPALRIGINVVSSSNEGRSWSRAGPLPLMLSIHGTDYQGMQYAGNGEFVLISANDEINPEQTIMAESLIP